GDRQPARGHQGLLPRPLPAAVRGLGRRRVLGLGDLRHPRPRVAAAGPHPRAPARHEGPCGRPARPLQDRRRARRRPNRAVTLARTRIAICARTRTARSGSRGAPLRSAGLVRRVWTVLWGYARVRAPRLPLNSGENPEDWKATSRARITLELSRGISL